MDWLLFEPSEDVLYVNILVGRLLELQPNSLEGTDAFCNELYPILDKIQQLCIDKNLKQVCKADLTGIQVQKIKPISLMRMIWNVYEYTKSNVMLTGCEISGSSPFFNTLFEATRGFLPPFMRGMIRLS